MSAMFGQRNSDQENSIVQGDEVCIVRFTCDLVALSKIYDALGCLEGRIDWQDPSFTIKYFRYDKGLTRSIDTFYRENIESKEFFEANKKNGYIVDSNKRAFLNVDRRRRVILWEPIFPQNKKEEVDVAYFQYFMLVLKYVERQGYRYSVRISAGDCSKGKYGFIEFGEEVVRLRALLYLYSSEELSKIYVFSKYTKDKENEIAWRRLKAENAEPLPMDSGKIFPLLSITKDTYTALVLTTCGQNADGEWANKLKKLYDLYVDRYLEDANEIYGKLVKLPGKIKSGFSEIEGLDLEINTLTNKVKHAKSEFERKKYEEDLKKKSKRHKFLREDIPLKMEELETLRGDKKNENIRERLVEEHGFKDFENDSLLEGLIYVSTLVYLDKKGLTEKSHRRDLTRLHEICVDYAQGIAQLIENIVYHVIQNTEAEATERGCGSFTFRIRTREDARYYVENSDETIAPSYFMELYVADFNYYPVNGMVSKFIENVENNGGERKWSFTEENVKLPHLFGEQLHGTQMEEYFSDSQNVAMHYGLQILNSVVMTGGGGLYVTSGSHSDNKLKEQNFFFNEYKAGSYLHPEFLWRNGTTYVIYLPIKYEGVVNYGDVIAVSNLPCSTGQKSGKQLSFSLQPFENVALTSRAKEKAVKSVEQQLLNGIKGKHIYYLDLSCVQSNHAYVYEILSKAVFLLLLEKKGVDNVALINIPKAYDVIKFFRQFALFYDRTGQNSSMGEKSVFFIDVNGELDLLLHGSIGSIKNSLPYGKIYGGYSDEAMEIINYLAQRTTEVKHEGND